ncbi:hypothetical protein RCL1_002238 [Eukaryota sp. TZLM3-RCL]
MAEHLQAINNVEKQRLTISGNVDSSRQDLRSQEENRYFLEVAVWLEVVLGHTFETGDWIEECRDGRLLCDLINIIKPGRIKRVHNSKMAFKCFENIQTFVTAALELGVDKTLAFEPVDLYELRNRRHVIFCVYDLARRVSQTSFKIKLKTLETQNDDIQASLDQLRADVENSADENVDVTSSKFNVDASLLSVSVDNSLLSNVTPHVRFTLNVDLDDDDDRVYIIGNHEKLGNWNVHRGLKLKEIEIGEYSITLDNPPHDLSYKFVRILSDGTVEYEEGGVRRLVVDDKQLSQGLDVTASWRGSDAEEHVLRFILEDGTKVLFAPNYDKLIGNPGQENCIDQSEMIEDDKNVEVHKDGLGWLKFIDISADGSPWTGQEWESVVTIDADYCWLTDLAILDLVSKCTNLSRLDVSGNEDVTDFMVEELIKTRPEIKEVLLMKCRNISGQSCKCLVEFGKNLTKFLVNRCVKIEDEEFIPFVTHFASSLTSLSFSECKRLTDASLNIVSEHCKRLTELGISDTNFSSIAIENVVQNKELRAFHANSTKTNAKVLEYLAQFSKNSLEILNVNWTNIGSGASILAEFESLKVLDISNISDITSESIKLLASSPCTNSLAEFAMTAVDDVADDVIAELITAAANTLIAVTLSSTRAGVKTIEALCNSVKMQTINVADCVDITTDIAKVAALPTLQVLNIRKCESINFDCLNEFAETRPEVAPVTIQSCTVECGYNNDDVDEDVCSELNEKYKEAKRVEFAFS